jgi:rhodanese-related sulfurtransferase
MKHFILALALCVAATGFGAEFADISHDDLTKVVKAKSAVIIDVNGSDSYKAGHIPGAIDFETNEKALAKSLPADKNALVIAYCGSPQCPAWKEAAKAVAALGYTNVKHYPGGISGWKDAGGEMQK